MKRTFTVLVVALGAFCTGCSRGGDSRSDAPRPNSVPLHEERSGAREVRLDADSPQLRRIKTAVVTTARMPLEEVIAP